MKKIKVNNELNIKSRLGTDGNQVQVGAQLTHTCTRTHTNKQIKLLTNLHSGNYKILWWLFVIPKQNLRENVVSKVRTSKYHSAYTCDRKCK